MPRFEKGDQVVITEDVRVVMGGPPEVVLALNGRVGRVTTVFNARYGNHAEFYDVQVGKDLFTYKGFHLRKASPLDLLARAAE